MIIRNKFDRSFQREVENTTKKGSDMYTRLNIQTIVSFESPTKFHGLIFTILNSFPRFPPEYLWNIRITA